MTIFLSRAQARRHLALRPEHQYGELAPILDQTLFGGEQPLMQRDEALELLRGYLLDPVGAALLSFYGDDRETWFYLPAFTWVGPGNAAPVHDAFAAIVCAPSFVRDGTLVPELVERRFAPRADVAVAFAVAALPEAAQPAVLRSLWADKGPEPELLALSLLQCGRVLATLPSLHVADESRDTVAEIVASLIALLSPRSTRDLSHAAAMTLGAIASSAPSGAAAIERIRSAAREGIAVLAGATTASFADEIRKLSAPATPQRWGTRVERELASSCAYILGAIAPHGPEGFGAARDEIFESESAEALTAGFIDGLLAAAHVPAITALAATLLNGSMGQVENALALASRMPLDTLADSLLAFLDAPDATLRAAACSALAMVGSTDELDIDHFLASRLSDPEPEVCAAAARVLMERGRDDLCSRHSAREPNALRRAIVLASIGELSVPVIGEMVTSVMDLLEAPDVRRGGPSLALEAESPLLAVLRDALLCSVHGLELLTDLLDGVPSALTAIALAAAPDPARDFGLLAPRDHRAELARVTLALAQETRGTGAPSLALYLLASVSAGDDSIADHIADELALATDDNGEGTLTNLLAALGEIRVATPKTSAALAPFLAPSRDLVTRTAAASIAGRALVADDVAWISVRELLQLGGVAQVAAWAALRDRARRSSPSIARPGWPSPSR